MDVICPHCNELYYDLEDGLLGSPAECENCGKEFTIKDAGKAKLDSPPIAKLNAGSPAPPRAVPVAQAIPAQPTPSPPMAIPAVPVAAVANAAADTKACPFCGETIKRQARLCRFCHSDLAAGSAAVHATGATTAKKRDFGLALLLIPLAGTFLAFFWISSLNLLQNPSEKLTLICIATVISTTVLAAMEIAGRPENPETKADSAVAFAIGMLLLWVVFFPYYMSRRARYELRYLGGYALLIAIGFTAVVVWLAVAIDERRSEIREIFSQNCEVRQERLVADLPRDTASPQPHTQSQG